MTDIIRFTSGSDDATASDPAVGSWAGPTLPSSKSGELCANAMYDRPAALRELENTNRTRVRNPPGETIECYRELVRH